MTKETLFRKVFCKDCCYLDDRKDLDRAFCGLPDNKDCPLQDWGMYARAARKFVRLETELGRKKK